MFCMSLLGCKENSGSNFGKRNITGYITTDQTWSGEIYITGDVWVNPGVTVTIKPGTLIRIAANSDDQHAGGSGIIDELTVDDPTTLDIYGKSHIGITIYGRLIALGTPEAEIVFTSDAENPSHTDWDGLWFREGSEAKLVHVTVEWVHTGPSVHGTDNVTIQNSTINHTFWGALHAFQCSPVFEHNTLEDIGHEAIDTHRASPTVRYNHIRNARTGAVLNFHAGTPIIFTNNTISNSGAMMQLQENAWVTIQENVFQGSHDTGGPWTYNGFTLSSESPSSGVGLADNVNVEIVENHFENFQGPPIFYERIGPNMGIGHTTSVPEPFKIGPGPVRIFVAMNEFINCGIVSLHNSKTGSLWKNFIITDTNTFK